MATLREYFDKSSQRTLTTISTHKAVTTDGEVEIVVQVHYDFESGTKYASLYIPSTKYGRDLYTSLLTQLEELMKPKGIHDVKLPPPAHFYGMMHIQNGPPEGWTTLIDRPLGEPDNPASNLVFTGTVFFYSDNEISEVNLALLKDAAKQRKLNLRWRGPLFARERSLIERPVAFISYDSRDKEQIARPLAIKLQQSNCPVWFDEFSLGAGDSLRESIEKGLKETAKCIVILSQHYLLNRRWTKVEFNSVFTREIIEERNVFLPVWAGVSVKDVYEYSPSLANRLGVDWKLGLDLVAVKLAQKIGQDTQLPSKSVWNPESK